MKTDAVAREREEQVTTVAHPLTLPLDQLMEAIGRDAREQPRQYLDETIVPHGGE